MLIRKYRLPAKAKLVHSSSYKSQTFRLMICRNNLPFNRFGFVIGKKIDKRSTVRNRAKRVLRSCIEKILQKMIAGYDMLFIIQKNAVGQKFDDIYYEIEELFKTKGLLIK